MPLTSCRVCGRALDDCGTCVCATSADLTLHLGGAREPEPPCTCKHCHRQFTFCFGFTPSREVCYFCGWLDEAERNARGR